MHGQYDVRPAVTFPGVEHCDCLLAGTYFLSSNFVDVTNAVTIQQVTYQ